MKKLLLLIALNCILWTGSYAQQYGWIDISNNLPSSMGTTSLSDLHFISNDEGWICSGALGEIYHTTDGGQTYTTQTTQYSTNAIYMLDSLVGYAGGQQGRVYKTTNGGSNWVTHGSFGSTLLDIDFPPNSDSGYCCGYNGSIKKITSSGISSMSSGVYSNLASISFSESQGFVCGESMILHFNGSWLIDQSYPTETYNAIHMDNETTGWTAGDNGVIIHTTDGLNWDYQTNPDTLNRTLLDVYFLNANEGWSIGNGGRVLHTTNGGTNWNIELDGWTSNMLRSVQFTSPTNGYVLGNNRTLFKYTLLTGVVEPPGQPLPPLSFLLHPCHPNPFNATTVLSFEFRVASYVRLEVFDIIGNRVGTGLAPVQGGGRTPALQEMWYPAGTHQITFDGSDLPSGLYFAKLTAGEFSQMQKLVLLK